MAEQLGIESEKSIEVKNQESDYSLSVMAEQLGIES